MCFAASDLRLQRYLRGLGKSLLSDFKASILEDLGCEADEAASEALLRWDCISLCCCNCDDCCDGVELVLSVAIWEKIENRRMKGLV